MIAAPSNIDVRLDCVHANRKGVAAALATGSADTVSVIY